ncbi:MAG: hypothetical protein HW403_483 [Dehalococcoidia bacterium]|nr:hypothetical protein [Dehalococcoidia bacterium]
MTLQLSFVDLLFLVAVLVAIPVGVYHVIIGLYAQGAMALGAAAVGLGWIMGWNPPAIPTTSSTVQPVTIAPMPLMPVSIMVIGSQGSCLLAYRPGDAWAIDEWGHLSQPLCSAAVAALTPVLGSPETIQEEGQFPCKCPLFKGQVTFARRAA